MTTHVEEKEHADLGPSGWPTWGYCPGAPVLGEGIVSVSTTYAKHGTAAHSLLETCLLEGFDAEDLLGKTYVVEGETFTVDMEMADATNTVIAQIKTLIDVERGDILMAEQSVPIGHLTGEEGAEGTADVVGIVDGGKTLIVGDLKYGKGVQVYASELGSNKSAQVYADEKVFHEIKDSPADIGCRPNGQLAMYALGVLEKFGLIHDEIERVKLVIFQPRKDWIDEFELSVDDLYAFGQEVREAAGRVELEKQMLAAGQELTLIPGEKQCRFCKAKGICPALKDFAGKSLAAVSASSEADFEDLTLPKRAASVAITDDTAAEKLAEFLRAVPLIEEAIKGVRAEVERRLFAGLPVPGYKLVQGKKGNRQWSDPMVAAKELTKGGRLKADKAYNKTPISPTQAEKLLSDRPKVWSKIAPLITQPDGKPSVAPESDPRPTYELVSTAGEFENLDAISSDAMKVEAPVGIGPNDPVRVEISVDAQQTVFENCHAENLPDSGYKVPAAQDTAAAERDPPLEGQEAYEAERAATENLLDFDPSPLTVDDLMS